ncbi:MAG: glycosyltransferase [Deltaproteobacteria bacterium]|nr:glycosyltransferase [Deltaproteobacteria bacterium]
MKVVDVAEFYAEGGGGVRTYIDHKLRAGAQLGHEVVVLAPGPVDRDEACLGGRIVWLKDRPMPFDPRYHLFTRARRVHEALTREAPDIVEGSSPYGGGWFVRSWPGPAVKSLVFHQDPVAVFGHVALDRFFSRARIDGLFGPVWSYLRRLAAGYDTTVVAGDWLSSRLARFRVPRVAAVPFGIDAGPFLGAARDEDKRQALLAKAGVPPDGTLLVTVSRHHPEKRLPVVLEAVRRLGQERPLALLLFGDGPQRKRIERLASGVPGAVVMGNTRDRAELARTLASADVLVHGSGAETYGLVVSEALAAGIPAVVPDAGGAAELVPADRGEQYRAGDVASCVEALRRLLARDQIGMRRALLAKRSSVRTLDAHFADLFLHYETLHQARLSGGRENKHS